MPDETLLLLASEVRGKTLRLLDGVTDDMARFAPAGLNNSILWHAGHALWAVDVLGVMPATGKPSALPPAWADAFRAGANPAAITAWPALADVAAALREQLVRLTDVVRPLTSDQLNRIVDPARNRTLRYAVLHGLHDEAGHQGEIWLLRKIFGKQQAAATSTGS